MRYDGRGARTLMALNGPEVATRWVNERRRTWRPLPKRWHVATHPAIPLPPTLVHCCEGKGKDTT